MYPPKCLALRINLIKLSTFLSKAKRRQTKNCFRRQSSIDLLTLLHFACLFLSKDLLSYLLLCKRFSVSHSYETLKSIWLWRWIVRHLSFFSLFSSVLVKRLYFICEKASLVIDKERCKVEEGNAKFTRRKFIQIEFNNIEIQFK